MKNTLIIAFAFLFTLLLMSVFSFKPSNEKEGDKKGAFKYNDFQTPEYCQGCHNDFYQQWSQAMMSKVLRR